MASPKVGEATRASIMSLVRECLVSKGYDVLQVASGSFGVPSVEGEDETAVRIVFQIPKGGRDAEGYDVFEEAEAYKFNCAEAEKKGTEACRGKGEKTRQEERGLNPLFFMRSRA